MYGKDTGQTMTASKEWLDEPDRQEFEHAGYKCLILRHTELGHLCGYTSVPRGHPCYGKHYDHIPYEDLLQVSVHGGLTFSDEGDGEHRPVGGWWFGFDCAHYMDSVPFMLERFTEISLGGTYCNFQYVRQEIMNMADQMAKLEFIDWQFAWVWPFLLPLRTAWWIWARRRRNKEQKKTILKIVCMDCGADMGEKDGGGVEGVTSSICKKCWEKRCPGEPYPRREERQCSGSKADPGYV